PRGFDAKQIDQPRHTVHSGAVDAKVALPHSGPDELGPNPGVGRHQSRRVEVRPPAADGGGKAGCRIGIDPVVRGLYPAHIGAEATLAGEVEGEVNAEAPRLRQGVDQALKRDPTRVEIGRASGRETAWETGAAACWGNE